MRRNSSIISRSDCSSSPDVTSSRKMRLGLHINSLMQGPMENSANLSSVGGGSRGSKQIQTLMQGPIEVSGLGQILADQLNAQSEDVRVSTGSMKLALGDGRCALASSGPPPRVALSRPLRRRVRRPRALLGSLRATARAPFRRPVSATMASLMVTP